MTSDYRLFGIFRLLLALMVVVQHSLELTFPPELAAALEPLEVGSVAVLMFFVLSGFIVTEAASTIYRGRPVEFIANRILRIYPTYLIALLCALALYALIAVNPGPQPANWVTAPSLSLANVVRNVLGILPGGSLFFSEMNSDFVLFVAWALRIELLFYTVVFALMIPGSRLAASRSSVLVGVVGMVLALCSLAPQLRGGALTFAPHFVLGAAVYYATVAERRSSALTAGGVASLAAVMVVASILADNHLHPTRHFDRNLIGEAVLFLTLLSIWLALVSVAWRQVPIPARLKRADRSIGDLTYPLYLFHVPALTLLAWLAIPRGPVALVSGIVLSAALGWLAHLAFETRLARLRASVRGLGLSAHDKATLEATFGVSASEIPRPATIAVEPAEARAVTLARSARSRPPPRRS